MQVALGTEQLVTKPSIRPADETGRNPSNERIFIEKAWSDCYVWANSEYAVAAQKTSNGIGLSGRIPSTCVNSNDDDVP